MCTYVIRISRSWWRSSLDWSLVSCDSLLLDIKDRLDNESQRQIYRVHRPRAVLVTRVMASLYSIWRTCRKFVTSTALIILSSLHFRYAVYTTFAIQYSLLFFWQNAQMDWLVAITSPRGKKVILNCWFQNCETRHFDWSKVSFPWKLEKDHNGQDHVKYLYI